MLQTLRNRRNRKGFTLAELLIVVAIIAVLVAIAVPLFVGALKNAEDRVKDANIRAVRAEGVTAILMDQTTYDTDAYRDSTKRIWVVTAKVTANGDVQDLKVCKLTDAPADENADGAAEAAPKVTEGESKAVKASDGGYFVTVSITGKSFEKTV